MAGPVTSTCWLQHSSSIGLLLRLHKHAILHLALATPAVHGAAAGLPPRPHTRALTRTTHLVMLSSITRVTCGALPALISPTTSSTSSALRVSTSTCDTKCVVLIA